MSAQGHRRNAGDINLTDMRDRGEGEGDMDEFTAKTNEIRRLHKVCRAKNAAVRQAYQSQVNCARGAHRLYLQTLRLTAAQQACTDIDSEVTRCVRAQYLHAARVLKDVLKELEG